MCVCSKHDTRNKGTRGKKKYGKSTPKEWNNCWDALVANVTAHNDARLSQNAIMKLHPKVPRSTMFPKFKAYVDDKDKHKKTWKLSAGRLFKANKYLPEQWMEELLCAWMTRHATQHKWHEIIWLMNKAFCIRKEWAKANKVPGDVVAPKTGWVAGFLLRHPALGARIAQNRKRTRDLNSTPERLATWFKLVNKWFKEATVNPRSCSLDWSFRGTDHVFV
jgi:hypothetical protein